MFLFFISAFVTKIYYMINTVVIVVAGTFFGQPVFDICQVQENVVLVVVDNDDAIIREASSEVLNKTSLVTFLQIELCSNDQDESYAIFIDKERSPT